MRIFESDNIWKRKMREEKAARNPAPAHDQWKAQLRSNLLWLIGGVLVVVVYLAAIVKGALEISLGSVAVLVIVSLYCVMSLKQILDMKKNEPESGAAKKKSKNRK